MALGPTLLNYISVYTARQLSAGNAPTTDPVSEDFQAATLFVDITGFTALTERLTGRGPAGFESLTGALNRSFGLLIDVIHQHGGDVVKFAGDSLIAIWQPHASETSLSPATLRAAQCALELQAAFHVLQMDSNNPLALRVYLGAGALQMLYVGGVNGRWEHMIIGDALLQVNLIGPLAVPGQVAVAPEAWQLIAEQCVGRPLRAEAMELLEIKQPQPPISTALPIPFPSLEGLLHAYLPSAVLARLAAGQTQWLAELRRVSVVFINLPELSYTTTLAQAHAVVRTLQQVIYHYEGIIDKLSVDDKGVSLLAAWGLPPQAHEDDAIRAVQASLDIKQALQERGLSNAIGIATGAAFCGDIGNAARREYTMIGDVVNVAARLMEQGYNDILCDEVTAQAASPPFKLITLEALSLKGKDQPLAVFRPAGILPISAPPSTAPLGRDRELAQLADYLAALQAGHSRTVVLEGEAGIGKSCLLNAAVQQAQAVGVLVLSSTAQAIERHMPYHAIRPLLHQLLGVTEWTESAEQRQHQASAVLAANPDLAPLAALLNTIVLVEYPETEASARLQGIDRAEATHELIIQLINAVRGDRPVLIGVEDAHWLDSASWTVLQKIIQQVPQRMVLITTRPLDDRGSVLLRSQLADLADEHIQLTPLQPEVALDLVCRRLGVHELPPEVADLIRAKAEGHPFWSEEIAYALRDTGMIQIVDGRCELTTHSADFASVSFPDTVQGVVISRIDRLTPQQQLTLKVASVIGRVFAFRALRDIYPLEEDKPHLRTDLAALAALDITPLEAPEPELAYMFKHAITQDVAYNLMLYTQRRQLHRAVVAWYERVHASDLAPYYAVLAHHSSQALDNDDPDLSGLERTLHYLDKASEQALFLCAYREVISACERARSILSTHPQGARYMREHVQFNLREGEARWRIGDYAEATACGMQARTFARDADLHELAADALRLLGNVAYLQHDLERAYQHFEESANASRAVGYMLGLSRAISNAGVVAMRRGDYAAARRAYQESLELSTHNNLEFGITVTTLNLALVSIAEHDYAAAQPYLQSVFEQARQNQWILVTLNALVAQADLWLHTAHPAAAATLLGIIQHHPATDSEIEHILTDLLPQVEKALGQDQLELLLARGRSLDLNQLIAQLIADPSAAIAAL